MASLQETTRKSEALINILRPFTADECLLINPQLVEFFKHQTPLIARKSKASTCQVKMLINRLPYVILSNFITSLGNEVCPIQHLRRLVTLVESFIQDDDVIDTKWQSILAHRIQLCHATKVH